MAIVSFTLSPQISYITLLPHFQPTDSLHTSFIAFKWELPHLPTLQSASLPQQHLQHKQYLHWLPFLCYKSPSFYQRPILHPRLSTIRPLTFSRICFWAYLLSFFLLLSTLIVAFNIHAVLSPVFKQTFLDIHPLTATTSLFRSIAVKRSLKKYLHSPFPLPYFLLILNPLSVKL